MFCPRLRSWRSSAWCRVDVDCGQPPGGESLGFTAQGLWLRVGGEGFLGLELRDSSSVPQGF